MTIKLYEFTPTRSRRCRWTVNELGLACESVFGRELMGSDQLKKVHPLGKLPALEVDGRPLFESAAIATWLADQKPEQGLAHKPGTWERALHDQWVSFALTEMEAHLWTRIRNSDALPLLPPDKRVPAIIPQCDAFYRQSVAALDTALAGREHIVGEGFSVTDIIVGFTANWGRATGLNDKAPNVDTWLDRLYQRPHCTLQKPS